MDKSTVEFAVRLKHPGALFVSSELCEPFNFSGLSYMGAANIHNLLVVSGPESDAG
jgi:hypothetical protein